MQINTHQCTQCINILANRMRAHTDASKCHMHVNAQMRVITCQNKHFLSCIFLSAPGRKIQRTYKYFNTPMCMRPSSQNAQFDQLDVSNVSVLILSTKTFYYRKKQRRIAGYGSKMYQIHGMNKAGKCLWNSG